MSLIKASTLNFLTDLRRLKFHSSGTWLPLDYVKRENLDLAEMAEGLKPTYLGGQDWEAPEVYREMKSIAEAHGFLTLVMAGIPTFRHRAPNLDSAILEYRYKEEEKQRLKKEILWIYRDESLSRLLKARALGEGDDHRLLGYPACCVLEKSERDIRMLECLVEGLQKEYQPEKVGGLVALLKADSPVKGEQPELDSLYETVGQSRALFPYLNYIACNSCQKNTDSPANQDHERRKSFAETLWPSVASSVPKVGRNEPCFCGSGKKFKKCHGA